MILYPNCKINIGLNILRRREDNYHEISSVFYPITYLFDILEIIPSSKFVFSKTGINIPTKHNICEHAFKLLKSKFNIPNVKIHLHKQIPIGAGMGGGSSDGAYTLKALNILFNLNLSNVELEKYALMLGADCPFFIENKPKHVKGIGDKMYNIDLDLSQYTIKLTHSNIHISSKESYSRIIPRLPKRDILTLINKPMECWKEELRNDFEESNFTKYPELLDIKNRLYNEGAIYASMTGSGSSFFGIFESSK